MEKGSLLNKGDFGTGGDVLEKFRRTLFKLCCETGCKVPELILTQENEMNMFSFAMFGKGYISITQRILQLSLEERERRAILAHELGHIELKQTLFRYAVFFGLLFFGNSLRGRVGARTL